MTKLVSIQKACELETLSRTLRLALLVEGDIAECGVGNGGTAVRLAWQVEYRDRTLHLFDTFNGMPDLLTQEELRKRLGLHAEPIIEGTCQGLESVVLEWCVKYCPTETHPGLFYDTMPGFDKHLCFVHVDADQFVSTLDAIAMVHRCLVVGGYVVFHDYGTQTWGGVKKAVDVAVDPHRYEAQPELARSTQKTFKRVA